MSAFNTVCGLYCAMVALVGIYFFVILAIMELRGNTHLIQILQLNPAEKEPGEEGYENPEQWDPKDKATAFFITAGIQLVFLVGCAFCGTQSMKNDALAEEERMRQGANAQGYQRVEG